MAILLLLNVIFQGILFSGTSAWMVWMPRHIRGLFGSCLVIPCSYDYSSYPPVYPYHIVWYQYVSRGYPVVFDSWNSGSVIQKFRGRTSLYHTGRYSRDCSLLIENLNQANHGETLYAWIDPDHVGSRTYVFYDVTSQIYIETSAPAPSLQISGGANIGDTVSVQCSTYHTCPHREPTLSLSGIEIKVGTKDRVASTYIGDGKYQITLTRKGVVKAESQTVQCYVRHPGGLSASATRTHSAKLNKTGLQ